MSRIDNSLYKLCVQAFMDYYDKVSSRDGSLPQDLRTWNALYRKYLQTGSVLDPNGHGVGLLRNREIEIFKDRPMVTFMFRDITGKYKGCICQLDAFFDSAYLTGLREDPDYPDLYHEETMYDEDAEAILRNLLIKRGYPLEPKVPDPA